MQGERTLHLSCLFGGKVRFSDICFNVACIAVCPFFVAPLLTPHARRSKVVEEAASMETYAEGWKMKFLAFSTPSMSSQSYV